MVGYWYRFITCGHLTRREAAHGYFYPVPVKTTGRCAVDSRIFKLVNSLDPFREFTLQLNGDRDISVTDRDCLTVIRPGRIRVDVTTGTWELPAVSVIGIRFEEKFGGES
jgi:hypothetical protein